MLPNHKRVVRLECDEIAAMDHEISNSTHFTNITTEPINQTPSTEISTNSLISFAINISLCIVSFVGNPLKICVVLRQRFRSTSTGFYILCLAIYDILFTIFWPLETTTKVSVTEQKILNSEINNYNNFSVSFLAREEVQ